MASIEEIRKALGAIAQVKKSTTPKFEVDVAKVAMSLVDDVASIVEADSDHDEMLSNLEKRIDGVLKMLDRTEAEGESVFIAAKADDPFVIEFGVAPPPAETTKYCADEEDDEEEMMKLDATVVDEPVVEVSTSAVEVEAVDWPGDLNDRPVPVYPEDRAAKSNEVVMARSGPASVEKSDRDVVRKRIQGRHSREGNWS